MRERDERDVVVPAAVGAPLEVVEAERALHLHGASRDELTEALWPAQAPDRVLPRFWQSVTDARRALVDAWVRDGERHKLDRDRIRIDLEQLDQLLADIDPEHKARRSKRRSRSGAENRSKAATTPGPMVSAAALPPPTSGCLSAQAICALSAAMRPALSRMAEQAIALDQFHEASWRLPQHQGRRIHLRQSWSNGIR